ncbi:MAG: hypothetical protein QXX17_04680 [Conexivisphaerales archaeon]
MSFLVARIKKNTYKDSMQLMQLTERAKKLKGVIDAAAVMGTENNKELLRSIGMLPAEGEEAGPDDILFVVSASGREEAEAAVSEMEKLILSGISAGPSYVELEEALKMQEVNFAVVSVPGEYAKDAVLPILERGISVHLFSDHVSVEDEVYMKNFAQSKGLLLLGPSAGTSIIGGKGIAFSNTVERGRVGIISASGTGLQEVSVLLTLFGEGLSQGFGVGGRDLSDSCMGIMTKSCIDLLEQDEKTQVICIVSKPAGKEALKSLLEYIRERTRKHYVLCLLGSDDLKLNDGRIVQAHSLHASAKLSLKALGKSSRYGTPVEELIAKAAELRSKVSEKRRFLRGLFSGGTLAYEAMLILQDGLGRIYSNTPLRREDRLKNSFISFENTIVDMGEEEFTEGRLHPMIDPTVRGLRLKNEMNDSSVAVAMVDVMLGYGSYSDPAGAIAEVIEHAGDKNNLPAVVAHVCGTENDPQRLSTQAEKLRSHGVETFLTNAEMSFVVAQALNGNDKAVASRLASRYLLE